MSRNCSKENMNVKVETYQLIVNGMILSFVRGWCRKYLKRLPWVSQIPAFICAKPGSIVLLHGHLSQSRLILS